MIKTSILNSLLLFTFFLFTLSSLGQLTYSSSNFYVLSGLEIGSYDISSNTYQLDEFYQEIYEPRKLNSLQARLGLGYNYNRSAKFSFGFEFVAGIGIPKKNTYTYYANGFKTFEAKDRISTIELGYLLDFALIGDLEGTEFTLAISPTIGIQGAFFKSEILDDLEQSGSMNYETIIHRNNVNGLSRAQILTLFAKVGPSFQYGISKYTLIYGSAKYAFAYSSSENDYIKRNNWLSLDFGLKIMLN